MGFLFDGNECLDSSHVANRGFNDAMRGLGNRSDLYAPCWRHAYNHGYERGLAEKALIDAQQRRKAPKQEPLADYYGVTVPAKDVKEG